MRRKETRKTKISLSLSQIRCAELAGLELCAKFTHRFTGAGVVDVARWARALSFVYR